MRIVVLGYVVRGPIGGMTWHHLHYLLGLRSLGYEVFFVEDSDEYESCYDPSTHVIGTDPTFGLRYAAWVLERFGFEDRWAYYDWHQDDWRGPRAGDMVEIASKADILINVSGVNPLRPWLEEIPVRVLIDTDPVFTQIRHLADERAKARADQHTHWFTFGENFGSADCSIPDDGFPWQPTRQPVSLSEWPVQPPSSDGRYTTVMQWDSYPPRSYGGVEYGMKSQSMEEFMTVPGGHSGRFELAAGGETVPLERLQAHGWSVVDPLEVARDPWSYRSYIASSKGEFSVAKHGYTISNSGWFSERSAAYLSSGRPVITLETGFSKWLDADSGVLPFQDLDQARDQLEDLDRHYARHSEGARAAAETYFDSARVLTSLIGRTLG